MKHDRQVAIATEPLEVKSRDATKPRLGLSDALERRAPLGNRLSHGAFEERDEQVVLAAEVEIDGAGRHARVAGHVGHLRLKEAVARKNPRGRLEDRVALVAGWSLSAGGSGSS